MAKANVTTGRKSPRAVAPVATEPEIFGPAINAKQVYELEEAATTEARGQQRRVMLTVMSKSAEELAEVCDKSPTAYLEMRQLVQAFLPHAQALAEMAQAAVVRLMVTDMREDTSKEDTEAMAMLKEGGAA